MFLKSLCVLLFLSSFTASRPNRSFRWDDIKYVYLFGDSYSFVPGTFGLESFRLVISENNSEKNSIELFFGFCSFIGDATRLAFTPEQLLTNEIIPNKV